MNSENELPLHFNPPAGWPSPTEEWLVGHQGWEPPIGWVPRAGIVAAPQGWVYWTKNPAVWSPLVQAFRAASWKSFWIGAVLFVGGIVVTLVGASTGGPFFVFWGAVLWGAIQMIRAGIGLARTDARVMDYVRTVATGNKEKLDRVSYELYLRISADGSSASQDAVQLSSASPELADESSASTPTSVRDQPLGFDNFVAMREMRLWTRTPWPSDGPLSSVNQELPGVAPSTPPTGRTRAKWLVIGAAAVLAIVFYAVFLTFVNSNKGPTETTVPQSVSTSGDFEWYYAADSDPVWDRCMDEDGCWIWYVASPADCVATMTFGFSRTETSAFVHTFERDVVLESSQATPVVVGARQAADYEYGDIVDVQCS